MSDNDWATASGDDVIADLQALRDLIAPPRPQPLTVDLFESRQRILTIDLIGAEVVWYPDFVPLSERRRKESP